LTELGKKTITREHADLLYAVPRPRDAAGNAVDDFW
jgi:hypothetical protein